MSPDMGDKDTINKTRKTFQSPEGLWAAANEGR